jgi:hypothetical protein
MGDSPGTSRVGLSAGAFSRLRQALRISTRHSKRRIFALFISVLIVLHMKCFLHNGLRVWKVPRRVDQERASIIPPPDDLVVRRGLLA